MQKEITSRLPLLHSDGSLALPGYAKKMMFFYNRENVTHRPFSLKEWNFYQIQRAPWVLQLTLGHVSYMTSVSVNLFNIETGQRFEFGTMKPLQVPALDRDPEADSALYYENKDFHYMIIGKIEKALIK